MDKSKACTKCSQIYPLTSDYFHRDAQKSSGLSPKCKICARSMAVLYAKNNAEQARIRARQWAIDNPEKAKAGRKLNYKIHGDNYRAKAKLRYIEKREQLLAYGKWYAKQFPEKVEAHSNRRRARVRNAYREEYTHQDVLNAHGVDCWLCLEPIDFEAPRQTGKPGWQRGLHLDHVVRIADGGPDVVSNVKPAHGLCNLRRSNG